MPMNPSQVRVIDPVLTTLLQGYRQPGLVGEALFPRVPVRLAGGQVLEFDKSSFKLYNTQRAPGTAKKRVSFGYSGKPYALELHSLESPVPIQSQRDAAIMPGVDLGSRAVRLTLAPTLLALESQQATLSTTAGNYDANHKVALAGATKWSATTGTPGPDIEAGKEAIRTSTGMRPNVAVCSAVAWKALRNNVNVIDRFKYTDKQSITTDMVANLFDLDKIVVGDAIVADDAGAFTDVWGNNFVLAYVPKVPMAIEEPSYGYTYTMEGHPQVLSPYFEQQTEAWIYGVNFERVAVLTAIASGYLIQNPN